MSTQSNDFKQRFVFENADVRGCYVHLDETCKAIQATHHYPRGLAELINEFTAAAVMLKDSIKADGNLTIQMRTDTHISLLMADCFSDGRVRAICEFDQHAVFGQAISLNELDGAIMAITITPTVGERYQSIVPIEYAKLSLCLEDYFSRSEQLPSRFELFATAESVVGVALHALPRQIITDPRLSEQTFEHLSVLLGTLKASETQTLTAEAVLTNLFHEDHCRVYPSQPMAFGCECSAERSLLAIQSLGSDDIQALINETKADNNTSVTVDCHFCFQRYELPLNQLQSLLSTH